MAITTAPKDEAAAEDAPVHGSANGAVEANKERPGHRNCGDGEAQQKDRLIAEDLSEPAREARDGENAGPERQPTEHLNEPELALNLRLGARRAVGALAIDDLRGHGVGNHVLDDDAKDDEKLRGDIKDVLIGKRDPAAGGAGKGDKARGNEGGADKDVSAALRTEDRHGIGKLPEHHLDGPGQRDPDRNGGELRGAQGQRFLDPECLGDGHETECAVSEINHEEGQVAPAHGAHGRD